MIGFVVTLCIEGLIGGVVLRAILPGEQTWSIGQTFAFGLILPIVLIGGVVWLVSRNRLPCGRGGRQLPR